MDLNTNMPFVNKHLYQMLTVNQGKTLDAARLSIQDVLFKPNGEYEVTCLAAKSDDMELNTVRHGHYTIKENQNSHVVLICNEEEGQFKGKWEVTLDLKDGNLGKTHVVSLSDGSIVDGVFQIAAAA